MYSFCFQDIYRLTATILVFGMVAGCRDTSSHFTPASKPSALPSRSPHIITLNTTPRSPHQMDPVTFTVVVSDGQGQALPGSQVGAELTMPTMDMGRNTVALTAAKPGLYTGTGRFSMDGDWVVVVTAVHGSDRITQTFPLHVR